MSKGSTNARNRFLAFRKIGRKLVLAWIICMMPLLSGCWDLRYLDRLGVVLALGVDEDPSGKNKLELTVQVVLPQNVAAEAKGSIGGTAVTTFTEKGDTLFEAIRKMSTKTSRRLFFSHTQMLIISEKMAKKGIYPLVDLIERNPDIRTDISVIVTRGVRAKDMLQLTTQMESIPVNQLREMVEVNQSAYASGYVVKVKELTRLLGGGKQQAVLPSVRIEGNKEEGHSNDNTNSIPAKAIPVLSTMAVFREGKLIDYLKPRDSRGLSWLQNKVESTVIKMGCPETEGELIVEVQDTATVYKVKQGPDGNPTIEVHISVVGGIQEIMCHGVNISDEKVLVTVGKMTSKAIEEEVAGTINSLQKKFRSDVLGWGKEVYFNEPNIWRKIEGDWEDIFPQVKSKVICSTTITGSGIRGESISK
ncbi:Ger(x)C family spore germination protein [Bacillus sp. FJAT-28004]|uniref:Ger(x)C family spore germination protein n=1 Tax=Bacillus sp. FJAT-28004 TaxID=1679165 RepID=UPI0006B46DBF|nr:Ger(x)C family spore germination protein [Bacillus sp. FJAT-28004]